MTSKQKYIQMRNKNQFDLSWFYSYFLENGGANIDIQTFQHLFQFADVNEIVKFLDSKFQLNRLEDSNGNLIKIVE